MAKVQTGQHVDIWQEIVNPKRSGFVSLFRTRPTLTSEQAFWGVCCYVLDESQKFHDHWCPNEGCLAGNVHEC